MWRTIWQLVLPKRVRGKRILVHEPADMGIDFALEATLGPARPPWLGAGGARPAAESVLPFGTDRRAHRAVAEGELLSR